MLLKGREIAYHLGDSEAKAYFCFQGTPELPMGTEGHAGFEQADGCEHFFMITADPSAASPVEGTETLGAAMKDQSPVFAAVQTAETDSAVILYTSGTTGQPKGAELSHSNLVLNALESNRMLGADRRPASGTCVTLPLFHSFGSTVQMNAGFASALDAGAAAALRRPGRRRPAADARTSPSSPASRRCTGACSAPSTDDVDVERIAANLRIAVAGGASLPVEIIKEFKARFDVDILEGYGLSETSPVATFNQKDRPAKPGSIGYPIWGVEVKLIDDDWKTVEGADEVGEIAIRGHNIMKGYYNRPEATAEVMKDGWFRSGDLARRDEDGYYYIVDRAKDMIIRGGFNVYPREIEEVLITHEAVSLAAVVGVPHESHGEEIKAYVILNDGASITEDELVAWGKEQMASYKYPRIVEFRDTLPMTATGKILKRELT